MSKKKRDETRKIRKKEERRMSRKDSWEEETRVKRSKWEYM